MKNRLLQYLQPEQPAVVEATKQKNPSTKPRANRGKGKRLIARIVSFIGKPPEEYDNGKMCIYVDGAGQYYVRGEKVSPEHALRSYLI